MSDKAVELFENYNDTKIIANEYTAVSLMDLLIRENVKSILFCAGGNSARDPESILQKLHLAFGNWEMQIDYCYDIPAEPDVEDVRRIVKAMEKNSPQKVIAVGGGSVLDAAKAAYLSYQCKKDVTELFGVNKISSVTSATSFERVICIPTTAGTGSEVTPYSNIVDNEAEVKKLIVEKAIIPQWAFVSADASKTMPEALTVTTALDALVHSIESLLNNTSSDAPAESEEWALESIRLIAENLPVAVKEPSNLQAREALAQAAALGGMCITHRPTSLPHLASFSLYGKVTHGQAVAALLPCFWSYYIGEKSVADVTMKLAGIFSPEKEGDASSVIESYKKFVRSVGGAPSPGELGLDKDLIGKIAADAVLNPVKLQSCPRKIDLDDASSVISGILEKTWQGGSCSV